MLPLYPDVFLCLNRALLPGSLYIAFPRTRIRAYDMYQHIEVINTSSPSGISLFWNQAGDTVAG
jgi:hypothetical protein